MVDRIFKITIYVNDQEEAKDFWVNKMGFVVRLENVMGENFKWIEVSPKDDPDTTFVLYNKDLMTKQNPSMNVGHPSIMLHSNDIEKSNKEMKDRGIKVDEVMNYPYGRMFRFFDNDDNAYLVYSEK